MTFEEYCEEKGIEYILLPLRGRAFDLDTVSREQIEEIKKRFPDEREIKTLAQLKDRMSGFTEAEQMANVKVALTFASCVLRDRKIFSNVFDEYLKHKRDE